MPCYNDDEFIRKKKRSILQKFVSLSNHQNIQFNNRIICVVDFSKDTPWKTILKFTSQTDRRIGLSSSQNQGHQNAFLTGLMFVKDNADAVINLDTNLQNDIRAEIETNSPSKNGLVIMNVIRRTCESETLYKHIKAHFYYTFMHFINIDCVYNHANNHLMGKPSSRERDKFGAMNLYLRHIAPLKGVQKSNVYYGRHERYAIDSKYHFRKMICFTVEEVTLFFIRLALILDEHFRNIYSEIKHRLKYIYVGMFSYHA